MNSQYADSSAARQETVANVSESYGRNHESFRSESREIPESSRYITDRSGGSNPRPRTKFIWAEELKCATGVYVRRWYFETPWFSIRLHHWLHSDDARYFHDHTWWFATLILKGSYTDVSPSGEERLTIGKIAFRPALHRHYVKVDKGGCWSFLLTGPRIRRFGFWVGKKFKKSNKYFLEHGQHVCD